MQGNEEKASLGTSMKLRLALLRCKALGVENVFIPPELREVFNRGTQSRKNGLIEETSTLEQLQANWGNCVRCGLHSSRIHLVFGEGNPDAQLVFVGEGPGGEEDRQGRPFVGKAGLLLTDIIEKGFKIPRSNVYITNIVKCRPPGNRDPQEDEIKTCIPVLWKQLELIKPTIICALGRISAQAMLERQTPISLLRGRFHKVRGFVVMPMYHPAYLLRNPDKKRETWEDVKTVLNDFPKLN